MNKVYWGNTVMDYLMVAGGILLCLAIIRLLRRVVLKRVRVLTGRTQNHYDDIIFSVIEKFILPYAYLFINYHIILQLTLHIKLARVLEVAMMVITVYYSVRLVTHVLQLSINGIMKRRHESDERIRQLNGVLNIVKVVIWFIGFIFFLDNIGYDVTTIIAGLGVGGIAIALAAQTVLGDLFSYFTIFFDKPFEIGDFIIVGTEMGTIEHIGIKTTRIRSLSGEQLIMSNSELTKSTIHNYKRMQQRRVVFSFGLVYHTKKEHLIALPSILKDIVEQQKEVKFDRAHLLNFGDFSINFEVVYIKLSADYNQYMDTQQAILMALHDAFESRGIEFAFPTRTIYVQNETGVNLPEMKNTTFPE